MPEPVTVFCDGEPISDTVGSEGLGPQNIALVVVSSPDYAGDAVTVQDPTGTVAASGVLDGQGVAELSALVPAGTYGVNATVNDATDGMVGSWNCVTLIVNPGPPPRPPARADAPA
jgi:hypothetical protein